ncbi:MAG: tetratricopeptide repeat protein [Nitrospirae bacterium]|nr:tetratricopeptide repeat protein [Nitrospirota bacterium]
MPVTDTPPLKAQIILSLLLIIAVFAVFIQVRGFDFVYYDDNQYILENPYVRGGISLRNIEWAMASTAYSNWFPVTWVSHMLDVWLYGLWPGGHHLTNVGIHALNSALLFLLFSSVTGFLWRGLFIAALFAFHPMHVESVAWVAERKDVLSAFFWISAMCAYVFYARRPSLNRYMTVLFCFILGLMSKPAVVALPVVLLLMDYWPLGRFAGTGVCNNMGQRFRIDSAVFLFIEKIPFAMLSAITAVITVYVQKAGGAVATLSTLTLKLRMENAAISYVKYIIKLFYPAGLGIMYRHPQEHPVWQAGGAVIFLLGVTIFAVAAMRRAPWFFTGWFWYICTLIPVIGAVKVGISYMADRYSYISYIGLFVILSMAVPVRAMSSGNIRRIASAAAVAAVIVCIALTNKQLKYWHNSATLFTRAIDTAKDSYFAYYSLGYALNIAGRFSEAELALKEAIRLKPDYAEAMLILGIVLLRQEARLDKAYNSFLSATRARPLMHEAYNGAGVVLMNMGQLNEAAGYFKRALAIDNGYEDARRNLGLVTKQIN